MKINTSTDYAIRILICLAKAGHVVSSSQLSQDLNISSRYVLLVLAKLQNAGMVVYVKSKVQKKGWKKCRGGGEGRACVSI